MAFLIYRPVMRLFKPHKGASLTWPADTVKSITQGNPKDDPSKPISDLTLDLGPNRKTFK